MSSHNLLNSIGDEIIQALKDASTLVKKVDTLGLPPADKLFLLNSSLVSVCSILEEGLRSVFSGYLEAIVLKENDYTKLNPNIQSANVSHVLSLIKKKSKDQQHKEIHTVLLTLSDCVTQKPSFKIYNEEIVKNEHNFTHKEFAEIAKKCGLSKIWTQICSTKKIENFTSISDAQNRELFVITQWNAFYIERNLIIHNLSKANGWSAKQISEQIDFIILILERLIYVLNNKIKYYK